MYVTCDDVVKCQDITKIINGKITCDLGDDGDYSYEDTCNITCDTGYTLTGSSTRKCLKDGNWSGMDNSSCEQGR